MTRLAHARAELVCQHGTPGRDQSLSVVAATGPMPPQPKADFPDRLARLQATRKDLGSGAGRVRRWHGDRCEVCFREGPSAAADRPGARKRAETARKAANRIPRTAHRFEWRASAHGEVVKADLPHGPLRTRQQRKGSLKAPAQVSRRRQATRASTPSPAPSNMAVPASGTAETAAVAETSEYQPPAWPVAMPVTR